MGRYFVNLSRLDMSIVIYALEKLKEDSIIDINCKEDRALCVLIDILKDEQNRVGGNNPKVDFALKNSQKGCAKAMDMFFKNSQK